MLLFCIISSLLIGESHSNMKYVQDPAPDGHRCGICPTYFQKVCAFDVITNNTYIFDNHCVMDLFNCQRHTKFTPLRYEHCVYFGNFAYVHGYHYSDKNDDYDDRHVYIFNAMENPFFADE